MLRRLYDWTMSLASGPRAPYALGAVSFAESSFFPIPPDILLIPMVIARRAKAFSYALLCTITSVLGGAAGYAIGALLFVQLAERLREHYLAQRYRELSELCDDYERRYPNLPALHRWRGQVQHLHERWEEARDSFTIAIESPGAKERAPRDYYAALRLRAETLRELRSRDGADERALDEQRLADLDEYLSGTADYARFLELHPDWEELAKRHDEDPRRVYEEQQIAARLERIKGLMRERRLKEIVREAEHLLAMASALMPFVAAVIALGSAAYVFDGLFIGLSNGRVLRNAVLIALAGYLPVALLATRIGSVRLLWSALAGFMVLRSGYQAYRFLRSDALDEPEP